MLSPMLALFNTSQHLIDLLNCRLSSSFSSHQEEIRALFLVIYTLQNQRMKLMAPIYPPIGLEVGLVLLVCHLQKMLPSGEWSSKSNTVKHACYIVHQDALTALYVTTVLSGLITTVRGWANALGRYASFGSSCSCLSLF